MAPTVSYKELVELLEKSPNLVLIDVRSDGEVARGRIPRSIHIPVGMVETALRMSPDEFKAKYGVCKPAKEDKDLVIYCQSGGRGTAATRQAQNLGYTNARHYAGAYNEWSRKQKK